MLNLKIAKNINYKINNPLSEAEYVALHAAIVHALKPIQLVSEKLCSQDVALHRAEGDFFHH